MGLGRINLQAELSIGNLIKAVNYQEVEGQLSGYRSMEGYEVYDGTQLASDIIAPYNTSTNLYDDTAREARRSAITAVGGSSCSGKVLSCYDDSAGNVLAVRKLTAGSDAVYRATTSGWSQITTPASLGTNASYKFINAQFDLLPGLQRKKIIIFASSASKPHYINLSTYTASEITHSSLPTDSFPITAVEFKNRLWLGYEDGRLYFSNVGNPLDFDQTTFSGVLYLEDEIIDLQVTKGDTLIVYCKNSIQLIKALSSSDFSTTTVVDYLFSNVTMASNIGGVKNTSQELLDDIFYIDKTGLTSIKATDSYGDFESKSYSKSVNKTFQYNYDKIIGSVVNKKYNQYRLFLNNGIGFIFTFTLRASQYGTQYKIVKGTTFFKYLVNPSCVSEHYFGAEDGYLYKIDSGTCYNGQEITTILTTSYFNYGSPTFIKRFREVSIEGEIPYKLTITANASFDYRYEKYISEHGYETLDVNGGIGSTYGSDRYGEAIYGVSENQTTSFHIEDYGTTMSVYLTTSNKYTDPHIFTSMMVHYSVNGRKI